MVSTDADTSNLTFGTFCEKCSGEVFAIKLFKLTLGKTQVRMSSIDLSFSILVQGWVPLMGLTPSRKWLKSCVAKVAFFSLSMPSE